METREVGAIWSEAIRLDYPLGGDSIVVDAGAYEGVFARQLFDKFGCRIVALEPVGSFYQTCVERFAGNPKVTVLKFGVSAQPFTDKIFINKDASSRFIEASQCELCSFLPLSDIMASAKIDRIDLLKINIEGAEYAVLEDVVSSNLIEKIRFLQVQFHGGKEYTPERLASIRGSLDKTHHCTWRWSPMTWESWEKRAV